MLPESIFAGKSIKYGKGVKKTHDLIYSGNELTGANKPDRKRVGIKSSFSMELAFSVQKQIHAIIDCIRN